jgi:collagenase-like PrtC family protease
MKILSPLDSCDEVEQLIAAGADEFYCGLLEEKWYEKYPVISINRRPAGKGHFRRFEDLTAAVTLSHNRGRKVFFTINEHYYTQEQMPLVMDYIDGACSAGVDALIVTDYGLMAYLRDRNYQVPIHISTGGTVFNWRSAKFYKELGAERITLPRHLAIKEIHQIVAAMPSMETTLFILNSRCVNVDGFCTFQHGLARKEVFPMFRNACMLPYQVEALAADESGHSVALSQTSPVVKRQKIWETIHVDDHPCGACALYEFDRMNITSLKIVGRGNPLERKLRDVTFLNAVRTFLALKKPAKATFRKTVRALYADTYQRPCRMHMCYYPEVIITGCQATQGRPTTDATGS